MVRDYQSRPWPAEIEGPAKDNAIVVRSLQYGECQWKHRLLLGWLSVGCI